jgi:hypothetical protein
VNPGEDLALRFRRALAKAQCSSGATPAVLAQKVTMSTALGRSFMSMGLT